MLLFLVKPPELRSKPPKLVRKPPELIFDAATASLWEGLAPILAIVLTRNPIKPLFARISSGLRNYGAQNSVYGSVARADRIAKLS